MIGGLAAVAAVVVAAALVLTGSSGHGGAKSADEAVRIYLEALARGDARGALAIAKTRPADRTFLTDEILKMQITKAPISNIRILQSSNRVSAHVIATFGDQTSDETIVVVPPKAGDGWKLDHGAIALTSGKGSRSVAAPALLDSITIFGQPISGTGVAYVFPGWVDVGSRNQYVDVTPSIEQQTLLNGINRAGQINLMPHFVASTTGKEEARRAIEAALAKCAQSRQFSPPNCPQHVPPQGFIDGTASWSGPVNSDAIHVDRFNERQGTINFFGMADFGTLTVQRSDGRTFTMPHLPIAVTGAADLTQSPPKITMGL
ncbi:hypothetical protein AWC27_13490 [Mycobacterium szulgai]|uniref:DUF4878 domain-containing protein n=1 Tax=Mycobacterium szulgai TaxID=1787 RepID=A0A1X2DN30_MYCSZ|nr:hypothetical protein AWC27_13490 [Mycobacterium szulgai]